MSTAADQQREFHERLPTYDLGVRAFLHFEEAGELELALEGGDRAEIARELADNVYVAYGTALVYGIDLDAALAEVHRANMEKPAELDHRGKLIKPKRDWTPPNMDPAITGIVPR